jgi:hypothetical protein
VSPSRPKVAASIAIALTYATVCSQSVVPTPVQVSSHWTDPATGLTWDGNDNGEDVSWKAASKYCRKLSLAGFNDWRVPNIDEVQGIFDRKAESPGTMGAKLYHNITPATWHVKGNLFLSGDVWTTFRPLDDRGKVTGYAYYFDFNEGKNNDDPIGWLYRYVGRRALCVRGSQAFPLTKQ